MTISKHVITAYVEGQEIDVIDASVTLDETWAPYAQAELTIALPNETVLDLLDPRNDVRVSIYMTQTFGNSDQVSVLTTQFGGQTCAAVTTAWTGLFLYEISAQHYYPFNAFGLRAATTRSLNLTLRERRLDYANSEVSLTLSSDEALLQDYALVQNTNYVPNTTSVRYIIQYVLSLIGRTLTDGSADGTFAADAGIWEPGQNAWDYLQPLIQAAGLRLYCDENRVWYLVSDVTNIPGSIQLAYTGTVTDANETISRDSTDWYDAVVIKYEYVDGSGNTIVAYDSASTLGFSKVLNLTYDTAYPGAGAAARVLARAQGRGRVNDISAISDYSAAPGIEASITMPFVDTQVGNLSAVTWNYPNDEMTVKTRGLIEVPDTAWIFTPAGIRWQDIPVGTSWTEYAA